MDLEKFRLRTNNLYKMYVCDHNMCENEILSYEEYYGDETNFFCKECSKEIIMNVKKDLKRRDKNLKVMLKHVERIEKTFKPKIIRKTRYEAMNHVST